MINLKNMLMEIINFHQCKNWFDTFFFAIENGDNKFKSNDLDELGIVLSKRKGIERKL